MPIEAWVLVGLLAVIGLGAAFALRGLNLRDVGTMGLYVGLSVAIDLTIAATSQRHGGVDPYEKLSVIITVELTKLVVSLALLQASGTSGLPAVHARDAAWMAIPAVLYTANNWLNLATLETIDVSVFAVVRETNLVFTAIVWVLVFKASLGPIRWACVLSIVLASVLAQLHSFTAMSASVMLALLLTSVNAVATVSNEKVLKGLSHLDINQCNVLLYVICGSLAMSMAVAKHGAGFLGPRMYHGFDAWVFGICCGQAFLGLVVSRLLRQTSAIAKGVLTVFRPLVLLCVAPLFTSAHYSVSGIAAGVVAGTAALVYLKQGPVVPAKPSSPLAERRSAYGSVALPAEKSSPLRSWPAAGAALLVVGVLVLFTHGYPLRSGHGLRHSKLLLQDSPSPAWYNDDGVVAPAAALPVLSPERGFLSARLIYDRVTAMGRGLRSKASVDRYVSAMSDPPADPAGKLGSCGVQPGDIELFCALKRAASAPLSPARNLGKCAIVSNSGEIRHHRNGKEIDAHETVIRVNAAPANSTYAEWVGEKETLRFIEGGVSDFGKQDAFVRHAAAANASFRVVPLRGRPAAWRAYLRKENMTETALRFGFLADPQAFDRFRAFTKKFFPTMRDSMAETSNPTTGALAMVMALSSCDTVNAYSMQTPKFHATYNYYEPGGSDTMNSWHGNLEAEHDLWTRLSATSPKDAQITGKMVLPGFKCVPCEGVAPREPVLSRVVFLARMADLAY